MRSNILKLHQKLADCKLSFADHFAYLNKRIESLEGTNTFITKTLNTHSADWFQKQLPLNKDNLLFGIPYTLKDNFATSGILTTGASKFLQNFIPPYSSTAYEILKSKGTILLGKVNLDEFGMGGTGTFGLNGPVLNIYDHKRETAGSSSGSVNAVAADCGCFSLGSDTGDSVRRPASFLGVVGYKPSYGLISRYGVYPFSPSLDTVGIIANYVTDCAIVAQELVKFDEKDYTSQKIQNNQYFDNLKIQKNLNFKVVKDIEKYMPFDTATAYKNALAQIKEAGHTIKEIDMDWTVAELISALYSYFGTAEALSCWSNLTGIPFGMNFDKNVEGYNNIVYNNRTHGFGEEVIRRFVVGTYVNEFYRDNEFYFKARRNVKYLCNYYEMMLDACDALILPSASTIAPLIEEEGKKPTSSLADDFLQLPNFLGSPSITIPYTFVNKMPFGININTKRFMDQEVLNIALTLEEIFDFRKGSYEK